MWSSQKYTKFLLFSGQLDHFLPPPPARINRRRPLQQQRFAAQTPVTSGSVLCLVLLQVPKCFVAVQIFWASPKIWLHLVPLQKLLCWHKNQLYWMQIIFLSCGKCLWLPQHVNKILVWHKNLDQLKTIYDLLTLFLPPKKVTLKTTGTTQGQNQPLGGRNRVKGQGIT